MLVVVLVVIIVVMRSIVIVLSMVVVAFSHCQTPLTPECKHINDISKSSMPTQCFIVIDMPMTGWLSATLEPCLQL